MPSLRSTVRGLAFNVLKQFMDMDAPLFDSTVVDCKELSEKCVHFFVITLSPNLSIVISTIAITHIYAGIRTRMGALKHARLFRPCFVAEL